MVSLLTQDKAKPLQPVKSGFKQIVIWNEYLLKVVSPTPSNYLDYVNIYANISFLLLFDSNVSRTGYIGYSLPKVDRKYYNVVMIDERHIFYQRPKNLIKRVI